MHPDGYSHLDLISWTYLIFVSTPKHLQLTHNYFICDHQNRELPTLKLCGDDTIKLVAKETLKRLTVRGVFNKKNGLKIL